MEIRDDGSAEDCGGSVDKVRLPQAYWKTFLCSSPHNELGGRV